MMTLSQMMKSLNQIIHEVQTNSYITSSNIELYQIVERDWMFMTNVPADVSKMIADRIDQIKSYMTRL